MIKFILIIFLYLNINASYIVTYNDIQLGIIKDIDTIKNGYLEATITNDIAKFVLGTDNAIFFKEDYVLINKEDYFQKKDKNKLLNVLSNILYNVKYTDEENKKISYEKNNNVYNWIYTNSKGEERKGYLIVNDKNELIEFNSFYKNIKILRV